MTVDGGSMKCGGHCENVCLQIGDYHLKYHMFAIEMGSCDIVLGANWIRTLGPIFMDFKELTMQFDQEGQQYKFQGIIVGSPEIISSHRMENMLKKGHYVVSTQIHAIQATKTPYVPQDLQSILYKHQVFFPLPRDSLLPMVFMIIPFPLSQEAFLPISIPIVTPFPKKMKLRKWFKNYLTQMLSALVRAPTLLMWSWSLRKKVLGACVLNSVPSKNSPLKTNFPFMSLMTSWMN
jgi:hypothetical protein